MMVFAAALFVPPLDSQFVAMQKAPEFVYANGRKVPRAQLVLHELTFRGRDSDRRYRFLLDWKTPVTSSPQNPFTREALLPILKTPVSSAIQSRFIVRTLWSFGSLYGLRDPLIPGSGTAHGEKTYGPIRISRIYRLAKSPPDDLIEHNQAYVSEDVPFDDKPRSKVDRPLLVVFQPFHEGNHAVIYGTKDPHRGSWSSGSDAYSLPYCIVEDDWLFNRMFSRQRPSDSDLRAIRRAVVRTGEYGAASGPGYLKGLKRAQVARYFGWPLVRTPIHKLLLQEYWTYQRGHMLSFKFKSGRVSSFFQSVNPLP